MTALTGQSVLLIAAALSVILLLVFAALIARVGAFGRHVDQRRARRSKFQDEWRDVITTADQGPRDSRSRRVP